MEKIDMIVKAPHFYTMSGDGVGYISDAAMLIDRGKIRGFMPASDADAAYVAEESIVLRHHAVFPGLIDAHMHTGICMARGLAQDIQNWMMHGYQPFNNAMDQSAKNAGSKLAFVEAIRAGTTMFGDYEYDMDAVCSFIEKVGVRGNVTQLIREMKTRVYAAGELYEYDADMGERALARNIALYEKWHNRAGGRIKILFGPQGPDFIGEALLLRTKQAARERGTYMHMHVQQGSRETYQMQKRYGKRSVDWLGEIGCLDETLIAVHLTDAEDQEAVRVAQSGAGMVVCPGSIAIIDGIVPPSAAFQNAGGDCGLGSDQAPGNNCHNIINEMKNVALFNKIKSADPEVLPAWKALRMATVEGARAIKLGDAVGSLEEGKCADFIAIDLRKPTMLPVYTKPMRNIVPNLVYSARGDEVALSVVDGRVIYRDGKILCLDEEAIFDEVQRFSGAIGERASDEFWRIHGTNAVFMEENKL